jgi:hypothetical protein
MHIKSLEQLMSFLIQSKHLNEDDRAAENYKRAFDEDKANYNLKPVEEKDDIKEEGEIDVEVEYETEKPAPKKPSRGKDEQTPSLDSLIRNINDLRSGESLKRADVRNEVEKYFDGLSTDEQAVLVLFIRELAAVATKSKKGDEAQDPSDDPTNYNISSPKKDPVESEVDARVPTKKVVKKSTALEDDSAPIKVNESQDLSALRKKFKVLIES